MTNERIPRGWAIVTGASGGIGEALAREFAADGYDVVLAARSADKLASVAEALQALGARTRVVAVDLQKPEGPRELFEQTEGQGIEATAIVNNAGFGLTGGFLDQTLEDNLGLIDLNVRALTELAHRFGRAMRARGKGGVLNVASVAAFMPGPNMAAYYASKAFVLSLTEALNAEWKTGGAESKAGALHASALCPGPVATNFQERADMGGLALMKLAPMMSAARTARIGYTAFRNRQPVCLAGWTNAMMARSAGLAPRGLLLSALGGLQRKPGRH